MSNLEKYKKAFTDALSIDEQKLSKDLKFNEIPEWDSIGHMTLISHLEDAFKCPHCPLLFTIKDNLNTHIRKFH